MVALKARRFNIRHDAVLEIIATTISAHLQPSERMSSDLSEYLFPQHIAATTLRPDIVLWDDAKKRLFLIELTICFETSFVEAAQRKTSRYADLKQWATEAGYTTSLITLEVGSRGVVCYQGFKQLSRHLGQKALHQSYHIWCLRNNKP